jgi:dipeptidyl aminopeptidase/acylaminoacyl peptidase
MPLNPAVASLLLLAGPVLTAAGRVGGAEPHPFGLDDFFTLRRATDAKVSPDGKHLVFVVTTVDEEKNALSSHLWALSPGSEPYQLTNHPKGESSPAWSPDSKEVAFVSSREGKPQIWRIALGGGEATQATSLSTGASSPKWSPDGKRVAFTSDVWPGLEGGDAAQRKRKEEMEASGIQARTYDRLLYRHWSSWSDGRRTHLFVAPPGGEARDLTPGDSDAIDGEGGFCFSPDGTEIAFTRGPLAAPSARPEEGSKGTASEGKGASMMRSSEDVEAWSTNADVWVVPVEGGEPRALTSENRGWDGTPVWSPDGTRIAFRSQAREGYEADTFRLAILERSTGRVNFHSSEGLDRSVDEILWAPDARTIYLGAENEGQAAIYSVEVDGILPTGPPRAVLKGRQFTGLTMPRGGEFMAGTLQSLVRPPEVAVLTGLGDEPARRHLTTLTRLNDDVLSRVEMPSVESVTYEGALGATIQAWVLRPVAGPPARRSSGRETGDGGPFVLFIHGGPQGAWEDSFHYRWNLALFAARGFTIMAPNPHGSTGFGQAFTEQISGDWGGACYEDLMRGVDWAVERGLADPDRLAAMGGSFGGYMVNWMCGHTDRFKALISHAGVYNLESMYGSTEELWFPEWDLRGTPWRNAGDYERFSPHRFAARFRTPTLVIHGELDFRVPYTEGLQLFTALRRQGVEARLLVYPDEGHWVAKPKNSRLWVETCFQWLERHLISR